MTFHDFPDNPDGTNKFRDNKNDGRRKQPRTLLKKLPNEESKMDKNEQKKKYFLCVGACFSSRFTHDLPYLSFLFL